MTRTSSKLQKNATDSGVRLVTVSVDRDGQRLDNFLSTQLKGVPKSLIYRLLRTGQVRINGKRVKPDRRVAVDECVRIPPVRMDEKPVPATPDNSRLNWIESAIVFEDRDFLVLNKPAGIASHGGSGISFGAIELLRAARPKDTLELAHRLDRDTSGVLVLSRRRSALIALQAAIRAGTVTKQYLTLLAGQLPQAALTVDAPLRKSVLQGGERLVRVDSSGKESVTHLKVLTTYGWVSLVEVTLETGRTHQIRVHCQHIGHAVAGDEKYGERELNRRLREVGLKRLFLHAARFEFSLPDKDRNYCFSAPLPEELGRLLDKLTADAGQPI